MCIEWDQERIGAKLHSGKRVLGGGYYVEKESSSIAVRDQRDF